jgi:CheY-like chemotaxis protein
MKLIRVMGGALEVRSEVGRGTLFHLSLPYEIATAIARSHRTQSSQEIQVVSAFDAELGGRSPLRILLAEDNPVNQRVAQLMLKRFGYSIDIASNGKEAVEALERQPYDLVFMDLHMPEMDGLQATRAIRRRHGASAPPHIVAMTAAATDEDRTACLDSGMNDYITKPFTPTVLRRILDGTIEILRT